LDHRGLIARAIIPVAIAITVMSVSAPSMPAAATEPAPPELVSTEPAPADPAPTGPAPTEPVVVEPAPVAPTTVTTTSTRPRRTAAQRLIRVARRQLGDRYVYGATGPRRFDCSGLVLYSLRHSHTRRAARLGGRSADSFYAAYRRHHRVGRRHGHPGDLVIWGGGRHVGIYIGHGRAISALTRRGVSVHGLHAVTMSFNGFLHTRLWRHR
jgi:cell wall-associated NlpC family hydrolase